MHASNLTEKTVLKWLDQVPTRNLLSLASQQTKHQKNLFATLLRHLLKSYVKNSYEEEKNLKVSEKGLLEHGLELSFKHNLTLPDQIWNSIFNYVGSQCTYESRGAKFQIFF